MSVTCPTPPRRNDGNRSIVFQNLFANDVWLGVHSFPPPLHLPTPNWDFKIHPLECVTLVFDRFAVGYAWFRTNCTGFGEELVCDTGNCDSGADCDGFPATGSTVFHFRLGGDASASPDRYRLEIGRGYNGEISVSTRDGTNLVDGGVQDECNSVRVPIIPSSEIAPELRMYADARCPNDASQCILNGVPQRSSACSGRTDDADCLEQVIGMRTACTALRNGWISQLISDGIAPDAWREYWTEGENACAEDGCRDRPATGTIAGRNYGIHTAEELLCGSKVDGLSDLSDAWFCSPYSTNDLQYRYEALTPCPGNPNGSCQTAGTLNACACGMNTNSGLYLGGYQNLLPTIGSTQFSGNGVYPQCNEIARNISIYPDFPRGSNDVPYAQELLNQRQTGNPLQTWQLFTPWRFSDSSSDFTCGDPQAYIVTFASLQGQFVPLPEPDSGSGGVGILNVSQSVAVFLAVAVALCVIVGLLIARFVTHVIGPKPTASQANTSLANTRTT